jgi:predicted DNA-binding transcriptional regulator AlpA
MTNIKHKPCKKHQFLAESFHSSVLPLVGQDPTDWAELHRAIRLPEVLHITGLSRSGWYALLNPGSASHDQAAPRPFKLGKSDRSPSVWWLHDVIAYLQAKSDYSREVFRSSHAA